MKIIVTYKSVSGRFETKEIRCDSYKLHESGLVKIYGSEKSNGKNTITHILSPHNFRELRFEIPGRGY